MSNPTCLIVGITGIEGQYLAKLLLEKSCAVIGVCRKPKPYLPENVHMVYTDMMDKKGSLAKLKDVIKYVTYLFFCAWVPGQTPEGEVMLNLKLFKNALDIAEKCCKLEHVYLQTGTKYYGMHLGPEKGYKIPATEDHPRLDYPVFYYAQEDLLRERAQRGGWSWSIARPDAIVGFSLGTIMNFATSLAVYATLLKEEGKPLLFPYPKVYKRLRTFCDAELLAKAIYWMCITPEVKNQVFNVDNGDVVTLEDIWNVVATHFGMSVDVSPLDIDFEQWFKERKEKWEAIVNKYKLTKKYSLDELVTPKFFQLYLSFDWDNVTDLTKLWTHGFKEVVNTKHMFHTFFNTLKQEGIIPTITEAAA